MYQYQPNKEIQRKVSIRNKPYPYNQWRWLRYEDKRWIIENYGLNALPYAAQNSLHYLDGFKFYSPTKLREVPVMGYLLPVSLFDETKVD